MNRTDFVIRNIYVMLAYAFRAIDSRMDALMGAERFEHLHDLLAEILIRGMNSQIKRGLSSEYQTHQDTLTTVRGKLRLSETIRGSSRPLARLVCEYDEYSADTDHNRAIKATMRLLLRHADISTERRRILRNSVQLLASVSDISPRSTEWDRLRYDRLNASYRLLLGVCRLIVEGLLPNEEHGEWRLARWFSGEQLSRLFERFLLEYFKVHHPSLNPRSSNINWDHGGTIASGERQLPAMRSDVTLWREDRMLIIDAKVYKKALQSYEGKNTVRSAHLYQILSYVKNADTRQDGSVSGLLLYARTTEPDHPDLDLVVQGNRIGAKTLDLGLPWEMLRQELDGITDWLQSPRHAQPLLG